MPRKKKTSLCAQRRALDRQAERLEKNRLAIEKREKAARERAEAKADKLRERHKKEKERLRARQEKELAAVTKSVECPPAKPRASRARRTPKKSAPSDDSAADRPATVAQGSVEPKVKIGLTKHPAGTAGITDDHNGIYAVTPVEGKSFKTLAGAARWLRRRNYNADGTRIKAAAGAEPSLTQALAARGIRHEPGGRGQYRNRLFNASGEHLGDFNAAEGWAALELGLLDGGPPMTPEQRTFVGEVVAGVADRTKPPAPKAKPSAKAPTRTISVDDIDRDLATRAYAGTSHTPERRAEEDRAAYVAFFEKLRAEVLEAGGNLEDLEAFRAKWLKRKREQLSRRQGLMSSMIVGPAKFPVARQRKRSDIYDRKERELSDWTDKQRRRLLGIGTSTAIRSTDDDAIERLQEKLEATETHRELAKKANAILRKKKLTDVQKRAALAELGLSESTIKTRMRFGPFIMANISGEARRIKQRIAQLRELAEDKERGRFEAYERGAWSVTWDDEDGRVRVEGPKPPTREATRAQSAKFKGRGFRWSPRNQAYQRQATENAWHAARNIVDELTGGT